MSVKRFVSGQVGFKTTVGNIIPQFFGLLEQDGIDIAELTKASTV